MNVPEHGGDCILCSTASTYAAVCRFTGAKDLEVYNVHMKDGKVVEVTRRYRNPKKKRKDDPEFVWKEV